MSAPFFRSKALGGAPDLSLRDKLERLPWRLCALLLTAGVIGALVLYSIAGGAADGYVRAQAARFAIGFMAMLLVAFVDLRVWLRAAPALYVGSLAMLAAVEIYGVSQGGATRWIPVFGVGVQPAEFVKLGLVAALAALYHHAPISSRSSAALLAAALGLIAAPTALIALQPDLGTAALVVAAGAMVMFVAGVAWPVFAAGAAACAAFGVAALLSRETAWQLLHDYQYRRIDAFWDPTSGRLSESYQITQSKIAIGSGGVDGVGYLQGALTRRSFLPEPRTDFAFTSLGEEFGLLGGLGLLGLYLAICAFGARAIWAVRSRFGRLLGFGVLANFFVLFAVNIAMVTGLAPVVGAPLPFISYAGSATVALLLGFGLLLSAAIHDRDPLKN